MLKKGDKINFFDKQRISHTIGITKTWIGMYNLQKNAIEYNGTFYKSLSGFVNAHHKENGTYKNNGVSGWATASYEVDGVFKSVSEIHKRST